MNISISENDFLNNKIADNNFSEFVEKIIKEQNSIKKFDLVIHIKYGLGKFLGLETVNYNNICNDFIKLEYADNVKLLIPVENFDLITKYSDYDENVKLDRLNSKSWTEKKAKIRVKLNDLANKLIKIASERKLRHGQLFIVNCGSYEEFCNNFPYKITVDQLKVTNEILNDLSSGRIMDRLLCGDVGFGKTEVAIRASFVVVDNKYKAQVAIVTPTTILCKQHYRQFLERFKNTNVKIASLSRFNTAKETNDIKKNLENGNIDIVIGTHALLNKKIKFKNLGLLIIDEEHRFGVVQKEKIKEIKSNTHLLSMSATPIPRTLQMSIGGIKDLSIISTPPLNRLNVVTTVCKYNDDDVKNIIQKEIKRSGKVFFVVPRIADIKEVEARLNKIIPDLKYCIIHGKMKDSDIDFIMNDFYEGKYDILISTSIIENGIDIKDVNTMIVYRANNFGLAQLYQLRGRVGRGDRQAFTYLTTKETENISDTSKKRLNIIESIKDLNSGFIISSEDMDMRGTGNILGDSQSGHIKEVGIDLYNKMLRNVLQNFGEENNNDSGNFEYLDFSPEIKLNISTIIPTDYIDNINIKMKFYKRIADIENENEFIKIKNELIKNYGNLPNSVENLLKISLIKINCKKLNIQKLINKDNGILITFYENKFVKSEQLIKYIFSNDIIKLKQENIFYICKNNLNIFENIDNVLKILFKL